MLGIMQTRPRGHQEENINQEEAKTIRHTTLASIETTRGGSISRQGQEEEIQPTLMEVLTQLQVMNQNIHGHCEDMKELGGRMGHLEVEVEFIKKYLQGNQ